MKKKSRFSPSDEAWRDQSSTLLNVWWALTLVPTKQYLLSGDLKEYFLLGFFCVLDTKLQAEDIQMCCSRSIRI